MAGQPIRMVIAVPGLSSHDLGAREVATACRDAGMEVIFLYRRGLSAAEIASIVIEEDAAVLGLSMHSGAHLSVVPKIVEALERKGADDCLLLLGGIVPPEHVARLLQMGVEKVFGPGTNLDDVVGFIKERVHAEARNQP